MLLGLGFCGGCWDVGVLGQLDLVGGLWSIFLTLEHTLSKYPQMNFSYSFQQSQIFYLWKELKNK